MIPKANNAVVIAGISGGLVHARHREERAFLPVFFSVSCLFRRELTMGLKPYASSRYTSYMCMQIGTYR